MSGQLKFLIVEDNRLIAEKIKTLLIALEHLITDIVESGEAALRSVKTNQPDIVIMDIMLKGKMNDGIETANQIYELWNIPILYLTSKDDVNTFKRAKRNILSTYVVKPFVPVNLFEAIDVLTSKMSVNALIKGDKLFLHQSKNAGGSEIGILMDDIRYIKADGRASKIFVKDHVFTSSKSLGDLIDILIEKEEFVQCHKSYVININYIKEIGTYSMEGKTKKQKGLVIGDRFRKKIIPLSNTYKDSFMNKLIRV